MKKKILSVLAASLLISGCTCCDWNNTKQYTEFATDSIPSNEIKAIDKSGKITSNYLIAEKFYFEGNLFHTRSSAFKGLILPSGKEIDGRVLIRDGRELLIESAPSKSIWFLTTDGTFQKGPELPFVITNSYLSRLSDGRILLVVAKEDNRILEFVLLYDCDADSFLEVTRLSIPRYQPGIAELGNKKILIVGGITSMPTRSIVHTPLIELVDLDLRTSTVVGQLHQARDLPHVLPLGTDKALIVGGFQGNIDRDLWVNTAEIYNGKTTSAELIK